jgi:hypothetical protein
MATSITFFPVGNGDMTLICLGDKAGTTILIQAGRKCDGRIYV